MAPGKKFPMLLSTRRKVLYEPVPGYVTRGRRRINGEDWIQANRATPKGTARAKAKAWRRQGRHARVIKVGKQWAVFVGGNNRRR